LFLPIDTDIDTNLLADQLDCGLGWLYINQAFLESKCRSFLHTWNHVGVDIQCGTHSTY